MVFYDTVCAFVHKAGFTKKCFSAPPVRSFRDELDHQLGVRPYRQASVPALTNALVAELEQIPAA